MILSSKFNGIEYTVGEKFNIPVIKSSAYVIKIELDKNDKVKHIFALDKDLVHMYDLTMTNSKSTGIIEKAVTKMAEKISGIEY